MTAWRSYWSGLRSLLGNQPEAIATLAVGSMLSGLTESGILAVLAQVAAAVVSGVSQVHIGLGPLQVTEGIGALLALAFGLALLRLVLKAVVSVVPARIASDMQARLQSELFASFTRASWGVQSRDREGELQELATNQIGVVILGALQATQLVTALLIFLVLVVSALALNILAALIVLMAAAGLFALLHPLSSLGNRRAHAVSRASISYAGGITESVRLAQETRVFGVSDAQRERIDGLVAAVQTPFFQTQLLWRLVPGIYQSLVYLLVVSALAALYLSGAGHVASLGAVVLLLVRAGTYGQQAQGAYQAVRQALPYLERLQEARRGYTESIPSAGNCGLEAVRTVAFEKVCYAYEPDRAVLSNITFKVADGETVGIVGPSGAGKSTLVQILLRLRSPDRGRYLINGVPADEFTSANWHRLFAYVPQEPRLLHGSVADNIRFFRDLDDDALQSAAKLAGIHNEVMKWREGYETIVGPRADAVSGGQQQRICLARALAAEPEVLVLDEPTSALDPHSERLIQESLTTLKHQLTLFVVAHRMTTLDMCERVMVVVDGRLEAFDTVERLQLDSSYYRSTSAPAVAASASDS